MVGEEEGWGGGWPPAPGGAPPYLQRDENRWTNFDNSKNAVSFGFVATAILISMFLFMAMFEKFLRTTPPEVPSGRRPRRSDTETPNRIGGGPGGCAKLGYASPNVSINAREVSVVMPGDNVPTFLACPAPVHCSGGMPRDNVPAFLAHPMPVCCPPERIRLPSHQQA